MHSEAQANDGQPPTHRRRALFLPGFAAGFLLLAILTCAAGLSAAGLDTGRIAQLRGRSAIAWTPPPTLAVTLVEETPVAVEGAPGGGAFRHGDLLRNVAASRVNVRVSPGYLGKPEQDVVAQAAPGETVEIVDGPQVADGLSWWYVRLSGGAAQGWMAEATANGVQILGE